MQNFTDNILDNIVSATAHQSNAGKHPIFLRLSNIQDFEKQGFRCCRYLKRMFAPGLSISFLQSYILHRKEWSGNERAQES